ncbi:MAG: hypothetical protein JGK38_03325 [Microcoleus sp. PH2017_15_JOR_U_A]|nr:MULTISPECIES: hypothetical protein [unclassified Microcoleus]MCC3475101.1 hypothetical protein [Microcoleus sp. PH2017_13_LAR_U_A]MCC3487591.1 hypothetical protein [Microcoleus sp. PH2017_14_LAR_D_A]MCC3495686.1 hypothetical protein [Microcoleus sp. PH2017_15_JOR_U_A]MCC3595683.1 hypothetical protein [Microcoleus sp. PH2017_26_ELK_O_A]MCC3625228.1 hypothetical protein [Microcoleus sp. PH2017_36_ELK_O_B]
MSEVPLLRSTGHGGFRDRAIVPEFTSVTNPPLPIPHYQFPITNSQ